MLKNIVLMLALASSLAACETRGGNLALGAGLGAAALGTGLIIAHNV